MNTGPGKIDPRGRKPIHLSSAALVQQSFPVSGAAIPLYLQPVAEGVSLVQWGNANRNQILDKLRTFGALLFRGFRIDNVGQFEELMSGLCGPLVDYSYRSTPRTKVSGKVYTSTEYPARETIPLHNEMSYSLQWPMFIGFFCVEPAAEGGETPIADSRRVYASIDVQVREVFARKRITYVRNYGGVLDLPWQEVFQTDSQNEVEDFCRQAGIVVEWDGRDKLCTSQTCQAVARHPATGEMVWFNQAHLFHVSNLKSEIRDTLAGSSEGKPTRNAFFGDGTEIEPDYLVEIRVAYEREMQVFIWQKNDVLLLDNMLTAHGRKPYRGGRQIVVAMGELFRADVSGNK